MWPRQVQRGRDLVRGRARVMGLGVRGRVRAPRGPVRRGARGKELRGLGLGLGVGVRVRAHLVARCEGSLVEERRLWRVRG